MKILQVHNYYRFYGGECSVVDAERRLLEAHGHEVIRYTAHSTQSGSSVIHRGLSFMRIPYNAHQARGLERFVAQHRPAVAHVHNVFPLLSPSVYAALKGCGVPVVQTVHNYRFLCPNGLFFTHGEVCEECATRGYFSAVRRRCVHHSYAASALYASAVARAWRKRTIPDDIDRWVIPSQFAADKLVARGVPRARVRICPNFVEGSSAAPGPRGRYFLYIGRLSAEKGLFTLLDAMRDVRGAALKIAGRGPLESGLRSYAEKRLAHPPEFLGFVGGETRERLVREALATVVPSECYENCPLSVAESLALGTPVIASRIGGLPEMVDHGRTGRLFDPGDSTALGACLTELAAMSGPDLDAMAARAAETTRLRFGAEAHYRQLLAIYEELTLHAHPSRG